MYNRFSSGGGDGDEICGDSFFLGSKSKFLLA